jgi:hypothetical protein
MRSGSSTCSKSSLALHSSNDAVAHSSSSSSVMYPAALQGVAAELLLALAQCTSSLQRLLYVSC